MIGQRRGLPHHRTCFGATAILTGLLALLIPAAAWGGPPFLTDDPAPVDFRHYEAYVFTQ
jgi:hypothetical protein